MNGRNGMHSRWRMSHSILAAEVLYRQALSLRLELHISVYISGAVSTSRLPIR